MNLLIGSHVSYRNNEQLLGCVKEALSYNANTFMFYTGAPQNTNRSPISLELVESAKKLMKENNIDISSVVAHAPYIVNLANDLDIQKYEWSIRFLKEELDRCDTLGVKAIALHPGSHVGIGAEKAIENIVYAINKVLTKDTKVILCLETMSGKGSEVGRTTDELKTMIDGIELKDKIGVCLDTCHLSDSGIKLENFSAYLDDFDKKIGIEKIKMFHVNDSLNEVGAAKDRHANIGFGKLGFNNLINAIYEPRLENVPKILETPYIPLTNDSKERALPPYKEEIEMIRNKEFNPNLIENIRKNAII